MTNLKYTFTNSLRTFKPTWIFNLILLNDIFITRVLIPKEEFDEVEKNTTIVTHITRDSLLESTLFFNDIVCNYLNQSLVQCTIDNKEYILIYESFITLEECKQSGSWENGNICSIYMPLLKQIFQYKGMYSYLVALNHNQDNNMFITTQQVIAKMRRLLQIECIAHFAVDDNTLDFNNVPVVVHFPKDIKIISNITNVQNLESSFDIENLLPQFKIGTDITTIIKDQKIDFSVNSQYLNNSKLTVKAINGFAPKQEIIINNGVGSFIVVAKDLEPGDKLKIQLLQNNRLCDEFEKEIS